MPKECCGYFSHPLDVYEASPGTSPWTSRTLQKLEWETAARFFVITKKKRNGSYLLTGWLQMQCSGASISIFLWSNYQLFSKSWSKLYGFVIFSPCYRSSSSHCHVMDLFNWKESFKEKIYSDNNWNTEWF